MRYLNWAVVLTGVCIIAGCSGSTTPAARNLDAPEADLRREAINTLVDDDIGRRPPFTTRYKQIAQSDPEPTVRAIAVRALNRARDKSATSIFISALSDKNDLVRLEGAKGLTNVPDRSAIKPLTKIVLTLNDNKDIRIAAANALHHYQDAAVTRALVSVLNGKEFGVAWQARESLVKLTGKDMRFNEARWSSAITPAGG